MANIMFNGDKFNEVGAYELMLLLHELHNLGYQKLRWLSYISPNGSSLRCHITTQDNIYLNREVISFGEKCYSQSVRRIKSGQEVKPLIRDFIQSFPALIAQGKGQDAEYVDWFGKLIAEAAQGKVPVYYGEYWSRPLGFIEVGKEMKPGPTTRLRMISWNIDGISAHFEALKQLVNDYSPDILCLQKVKDSKNSLEYELDGYEKFSSQIPYGGVATYIKRYLPNEATRIDTPTFKGHLLKTHLQYSALTLYNIYVPYSNPQVEGALEHRKAFDEQFRQLVRSTSDRIVICGDMNIVADTLDCWDDKFERK